MAISAKINAGTTLKYPKNLVSSDGEYSHRITFAPLDKKGGYLGMAALYLPPEALKTDYKQGWGDTDMGAIGQGILNAEAEGTSMLGAGSLGDAFSRLGDKELFGAKALWNQASQGLAQAMRKGAGAMPIGGESAVKAMEKVRGEIMNPHKAVMYTGPGGFRTFSYNFTMVARDEDEADEIAEIVHLFKYHMHPGLGNAPGQPTQGGVPGSTTVPQRGNIGTSLTLTYPSEWEIQMRVNKKSADTMIKDKILFQIDKCYLESCNVDYATGGNPAFFKKGGKPQTTTMSLAFKETTIMTKEKIELGF